MCRKEVEILMLELDVDIDLKLSYMLLPCHVRVSEESTLYSFA